MNGEIYTLEELSLTDLLLIKFLTVFDYLSLLIGGLPLPVIRLISNIRTTWGKESVKFPRVTEKMTKGLTLPANVGKLGPDTAPSINPLKAIQAGGGLPRLTFANNQGRNE